MFKNHSVSEIWIRCIFDTKHACKHGVTNKNENVSKYIDEMTSLCSSCNSLCYAIGAQWRLALPLGPCVSYIPPLDSGLNPSYLWMQSPDYARASTYPWFHHSHNALWSWYTLLFEITTVLLSATTASAQYRPIGTCPFFQSTQSDAISFLLDACLAVLTNHGWVLICHVMYLLNQNVLYFNIAFKQSM